MAAVSVSRITCPLCGRGERDKTLITFDTGKVHCHRCGRDKWREIRDALRDSGELPEHEQQPVAIRAPEPHHDGLADWAAECWQASRPLHSEALAYLAARACFIPPPDGDLHFHSRLKHGATGYVGPALVALVTDAVSNKPISLHRTWIRADGTKAPVTPARMLAAKHKARGGVIRLWPDDTVTYGLTIAEGIETALSVAHAFTPAWCVIDAGNMATFPVLSGIESLLIGADGDEVGRRAAQACAGRWLDAGREVAIAEPDLGHDWNDEAVA